MLVSLEIGIALVLLLGIGSQWLAWRIHKPSILLLLVLGFIAGPIFSLITKGVPLINPEAMLGEMLFPIVSISVALILFEGGLSLRFSELKKVGGALITLMTVGAAITWAVSAAGAKFLLGLPTDLALLLGAILVVTGPTVIGPLLQDIRPKGNTAAILKWEGIVIDPIGAILAVLVLEIIEMEKIHEAAGIMALGITKVFIIGGAVGIAGAALLYFMMKRFLIPDYLQSPISLMMVVSIFSLSNLLSPESGLVAVTVMGIALANQEQVDVHHIIEFKENLRVLLISGLFILLASNIKISQLTGVGWGIIAFLLLLIFVARPASVFVSTLVSKLTFKEKLFLSWMAPRGIVAAAVSSIFALRLIEHGRPEAEKLVPFTFAVIVATVTTYGLTAGPLAERLGLRQKSAQGLLVLGANPFALALAEAVKSLGFHVIMVDNNRFSLTSARMTGLTTFYGSILTRHALEDIDLDGVGRLLALSSNDEVNSLATLLFSEVFGRSEVYQLRPNQFRKSMSEHSSPIHIHGRYLFNPEQNFFALNMQVKLGEAVKTTRLTDKFNYDALKKKYIDRVVPLIIVNDKNEMTILTDDNHPIPQPGQKLVYLIDPTTEVKEDVPEKK